MGLNDKMNMILYCVDILDPKHNWNLLIFSFDTIYEDAAKSAMMKEKVKNGLLDLFLDYNFRYGSSQSPKHSFSQLSFSLGDENS